MSEYDVKVKVIVADLTTHKGINTLKKETENIEIGLLVNNAGREDSNHFLKIAANQFVNYYSL
jgi:short-subunit dehydrogenase